MDAPLHQRRRALFVLFFLTGLMMASWITRTPDIRDQLSASTSDMGLILFGLSIGSMTGVLSTAPLVRRFDTRRVIRASLALGIGGLVVMGLGVWLIQPLMVAVGLGLFGLGMGAGEVAFNVDGADVEQRCGRPSLTLMHGCFSLGTTLGALLSMALVAIDVPVTGHLSLMAALATGATWWALRAIPSGTGQASPNAEGASSAASGLWREPSLWIIGVIVLAMALAEGSANDWLPLLMVDGHGYDPAYSALAFAVFAAAMTVGRFSGNYLLTRFRRARVFRASAILCALGLAVVILVDNPVIAGVAVLFWGMGASLGFPMCITAASESGGDPQASDASARVALVASLGYVAFLVGPPMLGFLGEPLGLRSAMLVVLGMVLVAILLAPAIGQPQGRRKPTHDPATSQGPRGG